MATQFVGGPLNNELLFLSGTRSHRADYIFSNGTTLHEGGLLRVRRGNERLWSFLREKQIHLKVMEYIDLAGFAGVIMCDNRRVDNALVSALVERWRPETNTFHMPFGEVTVTLQDVEVLWGLKVDGIEICDDDQNLSKDQIREKFYGLTGILLEDNAITKQKINIPFVLNDLLDKNFPENPTDHECIQRARIIIYLLIGTHLFPGSASSLVDVKYLNYITDLYTCANYSWGSAVLACLYGNLCRSTCPNTSEIGGPVFLLQLWAWERLPCTKPTLNLSLINWNKPYGARWQDCELCFTQTVSHVLTAYRSAFNSLSEASFNWTPYDSILWRLPEMCKSGQNCWRSDTFLICWAIVEPHVSSRVLRQFGMLQPIPDAPFLSKENYYSLHKYGRTQLDVFSTGWVLYWLSMRISVFSMNS